MSVIDFPDGYYSNYSSLKEWVFVAFNPRKAIQAAELNDLQRMLSNQIGVAMSYLFKDGQIASGVKISQVQLDPGFDITLTSGVIHANGFWHDVPETTIEITGVGIETIGLKLSLVPITSTDDPDILSPAVGAENFGKQGAHRLIFEKEYVLNDPNSIPIATFENGQLVIAPPASNGLLDQVIALMEQRTREIDGSFLAIRPTLTLSDPEVSNQGIYLNVDNGIGYLNGKRRENSQTRMILSRPLEGQAYPPQAKTFLTASKVYTMDRTPIASVSIVTAYLQSPSFDLTRGATLNGSDAILVQYTPTSSIVSVSQAPHGAYTEGVDYELNAGVITWLSGGDQPLGGSTYQAVVQYTKDLTKAVRTLTTISSEAVVKAGATNTLAHTDLFAISTIKDNAEAITYVEGVDYTYVKNTGVITWIGLADATYKVNYQYWAHTVEGDYVSRDSFVTTGGNAVPDNTPIKTPTGVTVDFKTMVSFDTTGSQPVDSSTVTYRYNFALPRRDILAWREDGIFEILKGTPSVNPSLPTLSPKHTGVCKFYLPAEAVAADVVREYYDNVTLYRTDLRDMSRQIDKINRNLSEFQLAQDLTNINTPTDKIGIFADPLETYDLMDRGDGDYALTLDALAHAVELPKSIEQISPTFTSSGATLKTGIWYPNYTEETLVQNAFASVARVINKYGSINTRAKVVLSDQYNSKLVSSLLSVTTVNSDMDSNFGYEIKDLKHAQLCTSTGAKAPLASTLGISAVSTEAGWYETKIKVDDGWTDSLTNNQGSNPLAGAAVVSANTTVVENKWATITRNTKILVAGSTPSGGGISCSGSIFGPLERHITCVFNGLPAALTATGATVQDNSSAHPNAIKADSSGNWTADITIPTGVKVGANVLEFYGHDPDDDNRIQSYTKATYIASANMEYVDLVIKPKQTGQFMYSYMATFAGITSALGIPDFINGVFQPYVIATWVAASAAHTLAQALAICVENGITVDATIFENAIVTGMVPNALQTILTGDQIADIAAAVSYTSTDIEANSQAIINACPFMSVPFWDYIYAGQIDPLAQTFNIGENRFINSIELYFSVAPASDPVGIGIVEVENGIPTSDYLTQVWKTAGSITGSVDATVATKFTFDNPVFLDSTKDWGFVVLTEDNAASIWTSVLGTKDLTDNLITKNPSAGVCLESADARSWQPIASTDLKFKINACKFTDATTYINTGAQTFATNIGQVMFQSPFKELANETRVQHQYSLDNSNWFEIPPTLDTDLGTQLTAGNSIYFRIQLSNSPKLCPLLIDSPQIHGYLYALAGAYVNRTSDLGASVSRYFDVYIDTETPGGTTVVPKLKLDGGAYVTMTEDTGYATDIDGTFFNRRYTYDAGVGITKQTVKLKLDMTTANRHITPRIRKIRQISR